MKLSLIPPASFLNWILVAEDLSDPSDWSQFLLNHGPDSERFRFERVVQQTASECNLSLSAYRLLCKRGTCAFEYAWETGEPELRQHALRVGELLGLEVTDQAPVMKSSHKQRAARF